MTKAGRKTRPEAAGATEAEDGQNRRTKARHFPVAIGSLFGHISAACGGRRASGCSSGVEHNLAKVGVERSNRFTRSSFFQEIKQTKSRGIPRFFRVCPRQNRAMEFSRQITL
jgi:hypothetical protein